MSPSITFADILKPTLLFQAKQKSIEKEKCSERAKFFTSKMTQLNFATVAGKCGYNMVSAQEAAKRKRRIRDVAYPLFREKGVEYVTYGDISKLTNICESSIYHYYPRKSDILLETHKDLWIEIEAKLSKNTVSNKEYQWSNGYQQLSLLIDAFIDISIDHSNYLKFAVECKIYWNHQASSIYSEEYEEILRPSMQLFFDALKKGIDDGSVYADEDVDAACFLLWGTLRAYMEQIVIYDSFYKGENLYKKHFKTLKHFILRAYSHDKKLDHT